MPWRFTLAVLSVALPFGMGAAHGSLLTNGDFETGDLTGWTNTAGATAETAGALGGTYSLSLPGGATPDGIVRQTFTPVTSSATLSLLFATNDPGGSGSRSFNMFVRNDGSIAQLNLRVVDLGDNAAGDIQIFNGTPSSGGGWSTLTNLNDTVVFGGASNALTIVFNEFGGSFNYDVTVNGTTEAGLSFQQNPGSFNNVDEVLFDNDFGTTGYLVDDVTLTAAAVPEAAEALILLLGLAGLTSHRRRR